VLDLAYDPATDVLTATAEIRARSTQALSAFDLDLEGLEVRSVAVDGRPATWARAGQELSVTPAEPLASGSPFTTVVAYVGVPQTIVDAFGTSGFFHTDDGALVVGQPGVAATWFPANDHPRDAASFDIRITVPDGLEAVANGSLAGTARTPDGRTTWTWQAREPMAPYLAGMAIGEFELREYRGGTVTYRDAIDPSLPAPTPANARTTLDRQPEIVAFLEAAIGRPYPFTEAGGIVDDERDLAFSLENQTRPIYSPGIFRTVQSGESTVVHELAHQWFGDSVRLDRWQDIWLNEGFATYMEWLWAERETGVTADEQFAALAAAPAGDAFWTVPPGDPGPQSIFDVPVYERGAMTLHALRLRIGDNKFFFLVRQWIKRNRGGNVTTADFIALAEELGKQDLDEFFEAWLYTPAKPAELEMAAARAAAPALSVRPETRRR